MYGCTYAVFHEELSRLGVEFSVVDTSKPGSWSAALRPNTKAPPSPPHPTKVRIGVRMWPQEEQEAWEAGKPDWSL